MSERRQASDKATDLMWKVAYHAFETDPEAWHAYLALSQKQKSEVYDRCRSACMQYAFDRVRDEDISALSEDFPLCLSIYIAKIGLPVAATPTAIFPEGAPRVAAKMSDCLLRSEGFRLNSRSHQDFIDHIVSLFRDLRDGTPQSVRKRLQTAMTVWEFTSEPDEHAFRDVFQFKQLQGRHVAEVFVL